jgi:imidazolonepropionase-like amidohydrolase
MAEHDIAVTGATALVGEELHPVEEAVVLIAGTRIESISPAGGRDLGGAARIDGRGLTLVPGFIDAHVHVGFYDPRRILSGGVTTVRDLAWPPELIWPLVRASRSPSFDGPTIVAAGPMITVPGGYPTRARWAPEGTGRPVSSAAEARAAVEEVAGAGAVIVKVALNPPAGPTLDRPLLDAIVERAHELGLKVTAHLHGLDELDKALDSGVDELAHMLMSAERIPREVIDRMVDQDMAVVPTLSIRSGRDRGIAIDNLSRFHSAGGRIVYGTDLVNAGPRPGIDRREVRAMSRAGMAPLEIIRAATVASAGRLGLDDIGVLRSGFRADLVGVGGDPIANAGDLTDVRLVIRQGVRIL